LSIEQEQLQNVTAAAKQVLFLINRAPPHVRPWLRGIEAEAEHITVEVASTSERASRRFMSWLFAGLPDEEVEKGG
jgi:hypothetical protein